MKILHISTFDTGGAGIAAIRVHKALLKHGLKSRLLCLDSQQPDLDEVYQWNHYKEESIFRRAIKRTGFFKSEIQKITDSVKNLGGSYEIFTLPYTKYNLLDHPLVQEADILHLHWVANFIDYPSFFSKVSKPIVWTVHDLNPLLGGFHYEADVKSNKQLELIENELRTYKHTLIEKHRVRFVGVSKWTEHKIREYMGENVSADTIYVPLDFQDLKPVAKHIAKQALELDATKIVIGIGAQYFDNRRKGYWLFFEAYIQLEQDEKDKVQLVSFGNSTSENELYGEVVNFGNIENKQFQSLLYSAMDLFVLPSLEEALGLTGVEAMSCGTPILGSKVGGITDYLQEGVNGIFFTPGDSSDLLAKLKDLLNEKNTLNRLAENSRDSIFHLFDRDKIAAEYSNIYKELY